MSRDRSKLKVFAMADELVIAVYRTTKSFPSDVSHKLGFLSKADQEQIDEECAALLRSLQRLVSSIAS